MLFALRDYIARERVVSVDQLTRVFHMERAALQPMLDSWVQRGVIALEERATCSSPCKGCAREMPAYYRIALQS